jgi:hypothetical protein
MTQANDHPDTPADSAPETKTPVPAVPMEIAATLMAARVLNYKAPPQTAPESPSTAPAADQKVAEASLRRPTPNVVATTQGVSRTPSPNVLEVMQGTYRKDPSDTK